MDVIRKIKFDKKPAVVCKLQCGTNGKYYWRVLNVQIYPTMIIYHTEDIDDKMRKLIEDANTIFLPARNTHKHYDINDLGAPYLYYRFYESDLEQ